MRSPRRRGGGQREFAGYHPHGAERFGAGGRSWGGLRDAAGGSRGARRLGHARIGIVLIRSRIRKEPKGPNAGFPEGVTEGAGIIIPIGARCAGVRRLLILAPSRGGRAFGRLPATALLLLASLVSPGASPPEISPVTCIHQCQVGAPEALRRMRDRGEVGPLGAGRYRKGWLPVISARLRARSGVRSAIFRHASDAFPSCPLVVLIRHTL